MRKFRQLRFEVQAQLFRGGLLLWVLALMFPGCAMAPHQAAAMDSRPGTPPAGYGTLILYTPQKRFEGGATVLIDDAPVFKLHAQDYSWIYLRGGEHTLRTRWGHGLDNLRSDGHVRVAAGTVCYLKLIQWNDAQFSFAGLHAGIRTMTEGVARGEIAGLTYCVPLTGRVRF
jgi:hypothetical protein